MIIRENWLTIIRDGNNVVLSNCSWNAQGEIIIPEGVTHIGERAFRGCLDVTSVSIPQSVTSIDRSAFSCCQGLRFINVEIGNKVYDSRENCNAIIESKLNTLLVGCMNTVIPDSVIVIADGAFSCCVDLRSINIPERVTYIGKDAFLATKLTDITIPKSVAVIGDRAFSYCNGLASVKIKNNEIVIGKGAFSNCPNLTFVDLPNDYVKI